MLVIRDPRLSPVQILHIQLVLRVELLELCEQVRLHKGLHRFRRLWRYEPAYSSILLYDQAYRRTYRMLNFPDTLAGMTVFAPAP